MDSKFLKVIRRNGVTKVSLAILCLILVGGFLYFIVGSFLKILSDYVSLLCQSKFPVIDACENISDIGSSVISSVIAFLAPLLMLRRLLEKSYTYLALVIIFASILIYGGYQGLKFLHKK